MWHWKTLCYRSVHSRLATKLRVKPGISEISSRSILSRAKNSDWWPSAVHRRVIRSWQLGQDIYGKVIHFHCELNRWTLFGILHLAKISLTYIDFASPAQPDWHGSFSSGNRTIQSFVFFHKVILNCTKTMEINIPACINSNNLKFNFIFWQTNPCTAFYL